LTKPTVTFDSTTENHSPLLCDRTLTDFLPSSLQPTLWSCSSFRNDLTGMQDQKIGEVRVLIKSPAWRTLPLRKVAGLPPENSAEMR